MGSTIEKWGSFMFLVEKGVLFIYIGSTKTNGIVSWGSLCKSSFALWSIKIILISQSLVCRYQKAFNLHQLQQTRSTSKQIKSIPHQSWQIIIKVAASKNRKAKRYGFAFEATNLDGSILFKGGATSSRGSIYMATQEALVESILKAKDLGLGRILILCNNKKLMQICNHSSKPSWKDQALLSDLYQLQQQSLYIYIYIYMSTLFLDLLSLIISSYEPSY